MTEHDTYFSSRHCHPQWRHLLSALFDGLLNSVPEQEARSFLRQVGANMALSLPLGAHDTLDALEGAINKRWSELDWGRASLRSHDDYLAIHHYYCPVPHQQGRMVEAAQKSLAMVLEGVYGSWLLAQGGEPDVTVRLADTQDGLVLHYGKEPAHD